MKIEAFMGDDFSHIKKSIYFWQMGVPYMGPIYMISCYMGKCPKGNSPK
jgi:hypothetical protein